MLNTINVQNLVLTDAHWRGLGPILILTVGILVSMILATVKNRLDSRMPIFLFSLLTVVLAGLWSGMHMVREPLTVLGSSLVIDYFSSFFNLVLCGSTALVMCASYGYMEESEIHYSEFYTILMTSTLGMMLMASANELLTIFVALELMSLMVYVLVGIKRSNSKSNEASVKYFVMGGVSAAIYLYGMALIYGALRTTNLSEISMLLSDSNLNAYGNPLFIAGVIFVVVGFLFKIAAVPFHLWAPDVYEGAPINITSYMATALKAAVFAALVRISASVFGDQGVSFGGVNHSYIYGAIWWLALFTMIAGNAVALMQNNLKRLMAYSAIAHTGYLMVGLLAGAQVGYSGVLVYLVGYMAMNIGALSLLSLFAGKDDSPLSVSNLTGLGKKHPLLAGALTIFLLSLGGFPPTAGFVGKYYLFSGALEAGEGLLVLLGVLTSVVSVFYYLRLVVKMYMDEGSSESLPFKAHNLTYVAVTICLILTIAYGIFPQALIHTAKKAVLF